MICDDCKEAADLPRYEVSAGAMLTADVVAAIARADKVERARIGLHERCRRREDGCACQHRLRTVELVSGT